MAEGHHLYFVEIPDLAVAVAASVDAPGLLLLFDEADIFDALAEAAAVFVKER